MKRRSFFKTLLPALSLPFIFDYVFGKKNQHILYEAKPGETESAKLAREIYFSTDGITWHEDLSGKADVIHKSWEKTKLLDQAKILMEHRYKEGYWDMWEIPKDAFKNA